MYDNVFDITRIFKQISQNGNDILWKTKDEKKVIKESIKISLKNLDLQREIMMLNAEIKQFKEDFKSFRREIRIQNDIIERDKVKEGVKAILKIKDKKVSILNKENIELKNEVGNLRESLELSVVDWLDELINKGKELEEIVKYRDAFERIIYGKNITG